MIYRFNYDSRSNYEEHKYGEFSEFKKTNIVFNRNVEKFGQLAQVVADRLDGQLIFPFSKGFEKGELLHPLYTVEKIGWIEDLFSDKIFKVFLRKETYGKTFLTFTIKFDKDILFFRLNKNIIQISLNNFFIKNQVKYVLLGGVHNTATEIENFLFHSDTDCNYEYYEPFYITFRDIIKRKIKIKKIKQLI